MSTSRCILIACIIAVAVSLPAAGQESSISVSVPRLINYSGVAKDPNGNPMSGTLGVIFALYKDERGGAALWLETQNVQADAEGHYSVLLGASKSYGLPLDVFTSGEARWLEVQVQSQPEQPRVLLPNCALNLKKKAIHQANLDARLSRLEQNEQVRRSVALLANKQISASTKR